MANLFCYTGDVTAPLLYAYPLRDEWANYFWWCADLEILLA